MSGDLIIEWSDGAIRDMRRINSTDRRRIVDKVEQYAADPVSLANQVTTLRGMPYQRLRVGNYRVLFSVEGGDITVMLVVRVRHRSEVYG